MVSLLFLLFLALLGGASLGVNRSLIGVVGIKYGAVNASVINHISGTIFLLIFILISGDFSFISSIKEIPPYGLLGGTIGAFFVIITSFVIPKLGVLKTTVFFISAQVICGTIIDYLVGNIQSLPSAIFGVLLILIGVAIGFYNTKISK